MAQQHTVTLKLKESGKELRVFDEAKITHDIFAVGSPWTLALWHSEKDESTWKSIRRDVKLLTEVQVYIDDALQLDGKVERMKIHGGRDGAMLVISGRDLSAACIDSEVDPATKVKGMSVEDAIAEILSQFPDLKFTVSCEAEAARDVAAFVRPGPRGTSRRRRRRRKPLDQFRIRPGQKGWDLISEIANRAGCLLWTGPCDEGTAVILDTPEQNADPLFSFYRKQNENGSFSSNLLATDHEFTVAGIPTAITTMRHAGGAGDLVSARHTGYNLDVTESPFVVPGNEFWNQRYIDTRKMRTYDDVNRAAQRIVAQANRSFRSYGVRVQGCGQDGKLFAVNTIARLRDDLEYPALDENMLITHVSFSISRKGGSFSDITMVPPGLVVVVPQED